MNFIFEVPFATFADVGLFSREPPCVRPADVEAYQNHVDVFTNRPRQS